MAPKWQDDRSPDIAMGGSAHAYIDGSHGVARTRAIDDMLRRTFCRAPAVTASDPDASDLDRFVDRLINGHWAEAEPPSMTLLIAAARQLGDRWCEDSATFWDVTVGLSRLSRGLMAIDHAMPPYEGPVRGRVLLAPAPGDQHALGIATVAVALRGAGWDVTADMPSDPDALVAAARTTRFAIIGLSIGHERALGPTADLVAELRARSMNRDVRIALGGAILNGRGALAKALGADIHADDAMAMVEQADAGARVFA